MNINECPKIFPLAPFPLVSIHPLSLLTQLPRHVWINANVKEVSNAFCYRAETGEQEKLHGWHRSHGNKNLRVKVGISRGGNV